MHTRHFLIDGVKIRYQVKGNGPSTVLLIHGAVGSINDFALQMDAKFGLDGDKVTAVVYDLPGLGRSQLGANKKCEPTREYFEYCVEVGAKLMANLEYKTYSVAGWSDGARVASLLAIKYQAKVDSLLLWGFIPVMDKQSSLALARTRDINTWNPEALAFYLDTYEEQNFAELWHNYVDFVVKTLEHPEYFDLRGELYKIKCPTLILYGTNDPIVSHKDHVKPLEMQIYDSTIMLFKGLSHNIHQAVPDQFNQILMTLLASVRT